jgi:hypothetical protein
MIFFKKYDFSIFLVISLFLKLASMPFYSLSSMEVVRSVHLLFSSN